MRKQILVLIGMVLMAQGLMAQTISKEELVFLTSAWKGERFADGRPKIPDELLKRAAKIGIDCIRRMCTHFGEWLSSLELLGQESD